MDYKVYSTLVVNTTINESDYWTDYDYDIQSFTMPLNEIIPVSFIYGITMILGIVGNVLVIYTIATYQRMKTITNTFLVSLASADLLVILVCVPSKFAAFFSFQWNLGEFMCKAVYYIQNVSAICSVSTLTAMSLERYYAILHPVRSKYVCTVGRAKKVICILWIASLVLACPILYGREYHIVHGIHRKAIWCRKIWNSFAISVAYEIYMIYILLLVPVIIMTFAYVNICLELWHISSFQSRQQRRLTSPNGSNTDTDSSPYLVPRKSRDDNKSKKQVIKMLVAVIVIFIICWAPLQINNVLIGFEVLPDLHEGHHKHIREAFYIMAYANSSINPIIYTFMSKKFKETFKKTICACVVWRRGTSRSQTYRYATELRDEGSKTCHTSLVNHKNVIEMNSYGSQRSSSPSHV